MITLLPNLPKNTISVSAAGRISGANYEEALIPAAEAALKKRKKLRQYTSSAMTSLGSLRVQCGMT